jgi:predicted ATPase
VLDAVSSLLDKHLLYQTAHGGEEPRLLMLATIREYGWECLSGCGELEQVQHAHASYYLHLAEEADAHPYEQQWLDRLEWEHDNLRTALNWS